jgi:DNA-binding PucR family transcriptional regulator
LAVQRLVHRTSTPPRVASYDDVQVVALATQDEERADEFVSRTLGDFASAPAELRETARVYLREQSNATHAARILFTHRNTVLARLARAEQLLPAPLAGRGLQVALALEILHWRGAE